ncbi:MAG: endonuclease/exonuclease/phosphatase family protein [Fimbriimonadaceae bacterium]|nr:endonuclease/exonuclease/phosphatase family protein [Fimbriimonadaceae bacterium]QYK54673.1 MAG: endonuclease/exonuclease/phosphatase family protein [Fimbriimonadaceae bacterium]
MTERKQGSKRFDQLWTGLVLLAFLSVSFLVYYGYSGDDTTSLGFVANSLHSALCLIPLALALPFALARRNWKRLALSILLQTGLFVYAGQWHFPRSTAASEPGQIRVMSYNVQHCWAGVEKVAATIRRCDPDIVCMQELDWRGEDAATYNALRKALPEYRFYCSNGRTTATRLPIEWQREVWLTEFSFSWSCVETKVRKGGATLRVVNMHMPSFRTDVMLGRPLHQLWRRFGEVGTEQACLLRKVVPIAKGHGDPAVLAGDMNRSPSGQSLRELQRWGRDAWAERGIGPGWTMPSRTPLQRIDHVWLFGRTGCATAFVESSGASDHNPLVVDVLVDK